MFKDRNFVAGVTMVFFTATVMLASSALMAPYLESLAGYPVETAGWSMAPRGIGTMIGMQLASTLSNLVDHRKVMAVGLLVLGGALYSMSDWTPDVPQSQMMVTLLLQGFGIGFVFNPMTVMAFTTLPAALRGYATSLQALCRNIGQAVGVSVTSLMLVRGTQASHADIAAGITPFDRVLQAGRRGLAHAEPGDAAWRGDAGPDDQPAGADHCLQQRLSADGAGGGAAAAAAAGDAAA